jgi:hypothetical protein
MKIRFLLLIIILFVLQCTSSMGTPPEEQNQLIRLALIPLKTIQQTSGAATWLSLLGSFGIGTYTHDPLCVSPIIIAGVIFLSIFEAAKKAERILDPNTQSNDNV